MSLTLSEYGEDGFSLKMTMHRARRRAWEEARRSSKLEGLEICWVRIDTLCNSDERTVALSALMVCNWQRVCTS
jgi:hypothetical protein